MFATRAAVEEGTLPGGGVALIRATGALKSLKLPSREEMTGVDIVRRACEAPLRQIAVNSGADGAVVANKVKESDNPNFGFNGDTYEYGDMFEFGILDTTKVVRSGLQNAASVASLLLTTEALVSEIPEKKDKAPAPGMDDY
jgi:chaperonin GroEL